jgi:ribosomal protein S6/ribosomal protein S18
MKSKISEQNIYECILIMSHNEIENVITTVTNDFNAEEFSILHKETWGKRTLSYKILKNKSGYYFAFYINANKSTLESFNRKLRMHQDIMRFLILSTNEIPERVPPIAREIVEESSDSQKKQYSVGSNDDLEDSGWISFKNPVLLVQYISDLYKILPRRFNGLSSTQQRILKREINIARFLAILPFVPARKK